MHAKMTRHIAALVLLVLALSVGSALANELISECDDCCGETTCNDCVFCWCCSAVPALVPQAYPAQWVSLEADVIEVAYEQNFESLSLELLDPPPRT